MSVELCHYRMAQVKTMKILVFAKGDKVKEALAAGADYAGHDELFEKVNGGWTDFDAVIATPDMMRDVGKLGKVLGPRGLCLRLKPVLSLQILPKLYRNLKAVKSSLNSIVMASSTTLSERFLLLHESSWKTSKRFCNAVLQG